ncbi:collagen-binding domain-containing protein [Nocardioides guangzhouensis]|uniref:collagen-binding domain-containing protein n=1 Tax=Nocardioides guangzhouensis TaxID=2497878 RepID=UPI0014386D4E|nr:collagen-binding domain-containing protein [Nocardioides guangzhouensis]
MHLRGGARSRARWLALAASSSLAALGVAVVLQPTPASALDPVNPVRVDLDGHAANSGFLVFVEGDVLLDNDEAEGTMAVGGDLTVARNYNISPGPTSAATFTAPGDAGPTYLYVGGGLAFSGSAAIQMRVLGGGYTKIGDTSTYTAYNTDNNNAQVTYRIVPEGQSYLSSQFVEGTTNQQTPTSIETPVPSNLIDMDGAFALYRDLTQQMAACPATVSLTDANGNPTPRPVPPGTSARFELAEGQTNVLMLSATELDNLAELTFVDQPTASTPLLVNVTGSSFDGTVPNLAGIGGAQAPYILWNFPDASSVTVTGGASLEGTIYAPDADVVWAPTQNIEGNVIAASFTHGPQVFPPGTPREIHDFAFATTLECGEPEPQPEAHLTLVKEVVNDDGGTAGPGDWTLSATPSDPNEALSGVTGDASITGAAVAPGDWTLAEADGPDGYVAGTWTCDGGDVADGVVTLADGDDVTCTVVNDDDGPGPEPGAWLTLVKRVVNDDRGRAEPTDWTLSATRGGRVVSGVTGQFEDVGVTPGRWTLAESDGPGGYVAGPWRCDRGSLSGDVLTIPRGARVTCTIVNDDRGAASSPTETVEPAILPTSGGAAPSSAGVLPDTGGPSAAWAVAGLAALLAGAALVASGRREETD